MALNFPNNPTPGQVYTAENTTWVWNGTQWAMQLVNTSIISSDTPPPLPVSGQLWYKTSAAVGLYFWFVDADSAQWIDVDNGSSMTPTEADARYLKLTGGTLTGPLAITGLTGTLALTGPLVVVPPVGGNWPNIVLRKPTVDVASQIYFQDPGAINRWVAQHTTGADAAFQIVRLDAAGTYQSIPLSIRASDGFITLTGGIILDLPGAVAGRGVYGRRDGKDRWGITLGNSEAETGADAGSNFAIGATADDGLTNLGYPIVITRKTLATYLNAKSVLFAADPNFRIESNASENLMMFGPGYFWGYDRTTGAMRWVTTNNTVQALQISSVGAVTVNSTLVVGANIGSNTGYRIKAGTAAALGTNLFNFNWVTPNIQAWIDSSNFGNISFTSDYRTKKDVEPLPSKWEAVKGLRPISYTQAEYTPPEADPKTDDDGNPVPLFRADDIEQWGFIAHELQDTLVPSAATGTKDAQNLIQSPNPWTLLAALTSALQEAMAKIEDATARIEQLEAQVA